MRASHRSCWQAAQRRNGAELSRSWHGPPFYHEQAAAARFGAAGVHGSTGHTVAVSRLCSGTSARASFDAELPLCANRRVTPGAGCARRLIGNRRRAQRPHAARIAHLHGYRTRAHCSAAHALASSPREQRSSRGTVGCRCLTARAICCLRRACLGSHGARSRPSPTRVPCHGATACTSAAVLTPAAPPPALRPVHRCTAPTPASAERALAGTAQQQQPPQQPPQQRAERALVGTA
jgi:hypothetical protein